MNHFAMRPVLPVFAEHLGPLAACGRLLIFGVSNVCLCVSVVAACPWLKSSISAIEGLVDLLWPTGGEGPCIKSRR